MTIAYVFSPLRPAMPFKKGARLGAIVAGLAAVVGLSGCDQDQGEQAAPLPPAVGVIEVAEQQVNPFFEFVGKTRPQESVALRARVTGFLEERAFQEGAKVEVDQVLFRIEPEQYRATVAQAEAALSAAKATLNQAKVDLARYRELAKAKNISQQKVDEAEARVLVEEAAVETAEADLSKTRLDLEYTEIRAPINGRIDLAAYDVGNLVGPESGVMATINNMDPIAVTFSISETWYLELARANIDDRHARQETDGHSHVPLIRLPDGTLYAHQGAFDFFDNKVDEKTGTVLIRAEFPNPDRLLLPGQFVTVVVERREALDKVVVPQAAVLTDQAGHYVLLVDGQNKVENRRIETGQRFGSTWVVEEGLKTGERIILYGIQKVRPGLTVEPELTEAPSDPSMRDESTDSPEAGTEPADKPTASPAGDDAGDELDPAAD